MTAIEKKHWEHIEAQLRIWGFTEYEDNFNIGHDFYWSRPDEEHEEDEEIQFSVFLHFDKTGKFFTIEMTNENGHYCDNPLPHIKSAVDVVDLWKSLTGKILNL